MPFLELDHISKSYDAVPVLRGVSLVVERGAVAALLGPSGCGKTTLLRVVAGLERADSGVVRVEGAPVDGVPPHRRGFGLMFQDYALFPHLDVAANVAFGLRMQGVGAREVRARVAELLALVGLPGYEARRVYALSGGERQRVALARALAPRPRLLMLDEPLAALDRTLRERLQDELRAIIRAVGVTALYVTHDQAEAMVLADRLVVLRAGRVEQQGAPEELYRRPRSRFVAEFLGATNLVAGRVARLADRAGCLEAPALPPVWAAVPDDARGALGPGSAACVSVRPADVRLSAPPPRVDPLRDGENRLEGRVLERVFLGELVEYTVEAGGVRWKARIHPSTAFVPGQAVWLSFPHDAATLVTDADPRP